MVENLSIKKLTMYSIVLVLAILFIVIGYMICGKEISKYNTEKFYKARVTGVVEEESSEEKNDEISNVDDNNNQNTDTEQEASLSKHEGTSFKAKIINGDKKGDVVNISQSILESSKKVEVDDKIVIKEMLNEKTGGTEWTFVEFYRINKVILLIVLISIFSLILLKFKGILTIISIIFNSLAILLVYIPGILMGYNIYVLTIIIGAFIILINSLIINGFNKKTLCSIFSSISGILITSILSVIINKFLNITGLINEVSTFGIEGISIDLPAVIWGGIVLGSLGVIMNVAVTISEVIKDFSNNTDNKNFSVLLRKGMKVGKSIISTTINTLIIIYLGVLISTMLFMVVKNTDTLYLFNNEIIIIQMVQVIIGSLGLLFTVPITAFIAACNFGKITIDDMNKHIKATSTRDIRL